MDAVVIANALAAQRCGIVSRAELRVEGVTDRQVGRLSQRGVLVPVHQGIYRVSSEPASFESNCAAACVAAGSGAAIDRWSAALLHGLCEEPREGDERSLPRDISVAVPGRRHLSLRDVDVIRRSELLEADTQPKGGFRVTTPTRTLIDCAATFSARRLGFLVDEALRQRLTALPILRERAAELRRRGRAGSTTMAIVLAERDGEIRGSNTFERDVRGVLLRHGLPMPVAQHRVIFADGRERFLDLAYPAALVGIEAVSWSHHAQRTDWAADQERNNGLAGLGWRMVGVTWEQRRRRPASIADAIRAALRASCGRTVTGSAP